MKNFKDLADLGKFAAHDYIEKGIKLNDSLLKFATDNSLSREEINRVAEQANIETYLELLTKTADHYVQFQLADPKEIFEKVANLQPTPVLPNNDYEDIKPTLSMFKIDEKSEVINKNAMYLEYLGKRGNLDHRVSDLMQKRAQVIDDVTKITYMVKQALLQGHIFNNIVEIIKLASPSLSNYLVDELKKEFSNMSAQIDLEKSANEYLVPSTDSELFVNLSKLDNHYDVLVKTANELNDKYTEAIEFSKKYDFHPHTKIAGTVQNIIDFAKKHPVISMVTPAFVGGYVVGKNKKDKKEINYLTSNNIAQALASNT